MTTTNIQIKKQEITNLKFIKMKKFKLFFLVALMMASCTLSAQVAITTDGTDPDGSAMLDVKSTTKGFLPPRMTAQERDDLSSPATGLMIYCTTSNTVNVYNGSDWYELSQVVAPDPPFTCGTSTVTDIDGNVYSTVEIGGQCWFKEDLKVSKYPNGDAIPYIDYNATWGALADDNISDAYCVYDDNDNNGVVASSGDYGYLYSYAAAIGDNWARDNTDNQGVCPNDWHLPTDTEWLTLENEVETGATILASATGWRGTDVGERLKEDGTTHWYTDAGTNGNSSGFTALPGGYRHFVGGSSGNMRYYGYWWSAAENSSSKAWTRELYRSNATSSRNGYNKSYGYSVRCVRD